MNENISKIWIKIEEIEITIEGNSDFISKQYQEIFVEKTPELSETHPKSKQKGITSKAKSLKSSGTKKKKDTTNEPQKTENKNYSNLLNKLPNKDKVLLVAYYILFSKKGDSFSIREIKNFLNEKGLEIPNPSGFIKDIASRGKIIRQYSKDGHKYYRFTGEGEVYMKDLLAVERK